MDSEKFKVGDLVVLNAFGRTVIVPNPARVGVVVTGPQHHIYECTSSHTTIKYCTYEVMFGSELLTDIPEDFLKRMKDADHPDNPEGLEEFLDRGDE